MAFLDIFKSKKKKKVEEKLKRPSKGVLLKSPKKLAVKDEKVVKPTAVKVTTEKSSEMASRVLLSPHITEKAAISAENGAYIFRIAPRANKVMVGRAIKEFYGFAPKKVGIINIHSKTRFSRGKKGVKPGYKKAVVYLKKGDKIDIT